VAWTKLLVNKEAQKHKTSKKELDNMRAPIARDLAGVVREHETCIGQTHAQIRRLFRNLSAKAQYDRLHLLQRCDGDGSEGDPHPSIPVLQRNRRLDYEKPPFTEEVERSRNGHCLDWANPHAQK
jgi:hypothetical protein